MSTSSRSGRRSSSSSRMTRSSSRARLGAEAEVGTEPERDVFVGRPADVEFERVVEHGFVTVGGRVQQHQLLALRHELAAELDVGRGDARHVLDRRHPPQHLFDRRVEQRTIVEQRFPTLTLGQQLVHAATDHMAGGLVAADEDQQRLDHDLFVIEPVAVDLRGREHGHEIVGRLLSPSGDDLDRVLVVAGRRRHHVGQQLVVRCTEAAKEIVAPAQELLTIRRFDTQGVADDDQGQPGRDIPHQIARASFGDARRSTGAPSAESTPPDRGLDEA